MHPTPNWPFALWNLTISYGNPSDIPWMWRQSPWVAAGNSLEFVCECKGTTSRSPKWQLRSLTVIYDHLRSFTGPSSALEPCHADFADLRRSFFQIIWQRSRESELSNSSNKYKPFFSRERIKTRFWWKNYESSLLIFFSPKQGLSGKIYRSESFPRFPRYLRENIFFVLSVSFDVYGIKLETRTQQLEPEFTFELLSPSYGSPSVSNMSLTCCGVSTLDFGTHPVRMRSSFNVSARSKSLAKRRRAGR